MHVFNVFFCSGSCETSRHDSDYLTSCAPLKRRRLLLIKLFCLLAAIEIDAEVLCSALPDVLPHEGKNVLGP